MSDMSAGNQVCSSSTKAAAWAWFLRASASERGCCNYRNRTSFSCSRFKLEAEEQAKRRKEMKKAPSQYALDIASIIAGAAALKVDLGMLEDACQISWVAKAIEGHLKQQDKQQGTDSSSSKRHRCCKKCEHAFGSLFTCFQGFSSSETISDSKRNKNKYRASSRPI